MNKLFLFLSILTLSFSASAQIDISDARMMAEGTSVTIEGIATNGDELSIIRYIQDETGGIAAYPGAGSAPDFPESVSRGDIVQITGELKTFNGLLEIDPITSYTVVSSNNPLPDPVVVSPFGINEGNESTLLKINGVNFDDGGSVFGVGNYTFTVGGESAEIYVRSNHPLIGEIIPLASVNLTGISSEFNGQYQLLPRDMADLEIADNFFFTSNPAQSNITNEGFDLEWTTNVMGTTKIEYGTTSDLGEELTVSGMTTSHNISLEGLEPATFYYVKVSSNSGSSTIENNIRLYSTASNSSGTMRVYFNHAVDATFSNGASPTNLSGAAIEAAIINRINSAQTSIDCSIYNINRTTIVQALTEAYNNGIIVRYVTGDDTANLALSDPTPPFPIINGNNGTPLMHNKFIVIDAESEDDSWVITGSTNLTSNNIADDYNNLVVIQDQALARCYTKEFVEMWGSEGPTAGIFNIKFGEAKSDDTPHLFMIGGKLVESYFSPSDNTSVEIEKALRTANTDLEFALLVFTKNELGTAVRDLHDDGIAVRGIIDQINSQGSEFPFLTSQGVNVIPDNTTVQTHHKYAIIDATNPGSDPIVVTGSHNWSAGAEDRNDENTLIIHDADVANIFLQEFEARWCEATGGAACTTTSAKDLELKGFEVSLTPNPADDIAMANMQIDEVSDLTIAVLDMNGRILQSSFLRNVQGEVSEELLVKGLPSGMYLVMFRIGDGVRSETLIKK